MTDEEHSSNAQTDLECHLSSQIWTIDAQTDLCVPHLPDLVLPVHPDVAAGHRVQELYLEVDLSVEDQEQ